LFDSTLRRRVLKVADAEEPDPDLSNDEEEEVDEEAFRPSGYSLGASIGIANSFDFGGICSFCQNKLIFWCFL
jgi:hypothetical protein